MLIILMSLTDGMVQPPQTSDQMRNLAYAYNLAWDSIFLIHCLPIEIFMSGPIGMGRMIIEWTCRTWNKGEKHLIGSPAGFPI